MPCLHITNITLWKLLYAYIFIDICERQIITQQFVNYQNPVSTLLMSISENYSTYLFSLTYVNGDN